MSKKYKQVSLFELEGQILDFLIEDGYKIKGLQLLSSNSVCQIKLSKEARASVGKVLHRGDQLKVWGERSTKEGGVEKLKAYKITVIATAQTEPPATSTKPAKPKKPEITLLVCQKSDCMKRGGKALCQSLQKELSDRQLTDQVTVRMTGCMKQCKAGPNLVVMPEKARYTRITPAEVPALLERHLPQPLEANR